MEIKVLINAPEIVEALNNLANAISSKGLLPQTPEAPKKPRTAAKPVEVVKESEPEIIEEQQEISIPETKPEIKQPEAPIYTLDQVRAKLAGLSQKGKAAEVKALIMTCGADKLTDIPVEKYSDLMEKAEQLEV